jgi:hypothetical protein
MNPNIRQVFLEASQKFLALKDLEQLLETSEKKDSPLFLAYKAATLALYAKYSLVPAMKLSYFLQANGLLEQAIAENPENIEIRFIRFAVEHHLPAAASNYALHLREDKKIIIENLVRSKLNRAFKASIAQILWHSGLCTFADKKVLEKYIPAEN